jgi:hypothetical protein
MLEATTTKHVDKNSTKLINLSLTLTKDYSENKLISTFSIKTKYLSRLKELTTEKMYL